MVIDQTLRIEGLGDVGVCAQTQPVLPVCPPILARQKDDGNRPRALLLLQPPADLVSIHARHEHVEHDQVGGSSATRRKASSRWPR